MNTFILIMALWSGNGGVATSNVEFTGPNAEVNCQKAAEKWEYKMDSFSVSASAYCTIK